MSRLEKMKQVSSSVVSDLTRESSKVLYKRATFSLREADIQDLNEFVRHINQDSLGLPLNKSHVVRSALRLLYAQKNPLTHL